MKQLLIHRSSVSLFIGLVGLATGCADTDERPANALLVTTEAGAGDGWLMTRDMLPESMSYPMRLRIDGADVIAELDQGWEYAQFLTSGYGLGTAVPVGSHLVEILDLDGQPITSTAADIAPYDLGYSTTFVYGIHDAFNHVPDRPVAVTTANIAVHSSLSVPVVVERCFDDSRCTLVATIAPGGDWQAEVPLEVTADSEILRVRRDGDTDPLHTSQIAGLSAFGTCDRTLGVFLINATGPDARYIPFERNCFGG